MTIQFASAASTGTINVINSMSCSFSTGDYLTITAPPSADSTLADVFITLKGTV
jgi:hypothetical protein